jgi:hypothetical protein
MKSKSNQIFLVLLLISVICSCARNVGDGELVYKLSTPENCNFLNESIKVSYEIVQPQASCTDAYMSAISKIIEHKGRLYIMATETNSILRTNTIFIFTDSGEFIKKLSLGRGAGEFPAAGGMDVDKANDILEVYSGFSSGIYRYTLDGEFIEMIELPRKTYIGMEKSGGSYLLYTPRITAKNSHYFHLYNPQSGELKSYFEGVELPLSSGSAIYKDKDGKFLFAKPYSGDFYTFDDSLNAVPAFRFEPTIPQDALQSSIPNDKAGSKQLDELSYNKYRSVRMLAKLGEDLYSVDALFDSKSVKLLYNKKTGESFYGIFERAWFASLVSADNLWHYYVISPERLEKFMQQEFHTETAKQIVNDLAKYQQMDPDCEGNQIIIKVRYE